MANTTFDKIKHTQSMQDTDFIVVVVDGKEHLISKENFSKIISLLTTEQKNKLTAILLSGDGSKILTDSGVYKSLNTMFSQDQFNLNDSTKLLEINGYHTHSNNEVLDKFSVNGDTLLFDGSALSSYTLPTATENSIGGVKVDGTTITVSDDGTISGANNYELPVATNTVLGGVKVDGDTIKINNGVISADVIGNWASGVEYPVGYFVVHNNTLYQCIKANSDTEWNDDNWNLIAGGNIASVSITEWQDNTDYSVNDLVIYENTLYRCIETHTSVTEFDTTKWIGLSGTKGDKGDKGEDGINGTDGVSPAVTATVTSAGVTINITDVNGTQSVGILNGTNGTNGVDGEDGKDGANGKSAYEIAVDSGFKGTEKDWLKSLHGEDGETTIVTEKIDKICAFLADGWSNTIPYTQTVEVQGVTENLNPRIDVIISDNIVTGKKEENDFSYFTRVTTGDGILTAYCYETKPTVDLNIMIEVI